MSWTWIEWSNIDGCCKFKLLNRNNREKGVFPTNFLKGFDQLIVRDMNT